ncbi:MAG: fumarylacetoacetate hydrolase family protein [Candidatus Omnitrophica bacterium]|nr:fumarylacetoacetate hydrolase family protein [Candidatus Omnitrophota bacterium]
MKIARFVHKGKVCCGVIKNNDLHIIDGSVFGRFKVTDKKTCVRDVKILSPVEPTKVVCVGLNYKDHAKELNMPVPDAPVLFMKPSTAVIAHNEAIAYPESVKRLDYEAELAIVIKKRAKGVSKKDAGNYILGYTCLNDVTARDIQKTDGQWTRAKSFDTFCPIGPCIVTDIDPNNLAIMLYLNKKVMQSSTTANLIFKPEEIISFISDVMTLNPGDVIATGTPPGVGPMKKGDRVTVDIEKIGSLINFVV